MTSNRRSFVVQSLAGAGLVASVGLSTQVLAQVALTEADPQAKALAYVADAGKTDKVKFPKYAVGQACNNCALFQGKTSDAAGGCPLFAGKQVAGKGWCSAWAKKA